MCPLTGSVATKQKGKKKKKNANSQTVRNGETKFRGEWLARRSHICNPGCTCTRLTYVHARIYFAAFTTRHPHQVASRDEIMRRTANVRGKLTRALSTERKGRTAPLPPPLEGCLCEVCGKDRSLAPAVSCFSHPTNILNIYGD